MRSGAVVTQCFRDEVWCRSYSMFQYSMFQYSMCQRTGMCYTCVGVLCHCHACVLKLSHMCTYV